MAYINEKGFFTTELPSDLCQKAVTYPPLPETIREFFMQFETACVVDCCGIDAFDFSLPHASDTRWKSSLSLGRLLEEEIEKAEAFNASVLKVWELNQLLSKEDFVFLLRYLVEGLQTIREGRPWSLESFLEGVNEKNLHGKISTGPSVGREAW